MSQENLVRLTAKGLTVSQVEVTTNHDRIFLELDYVESTDGNTRKKAVINTPFGMSKDFRGVFNEKEITHLEDKASWEEKDIRAEKTKVNLVASF